jgi:hypothetical protein
MVARPDNKNRKEIATAAYDLSKATTNRDGHLLWVHIISVENWFLRNRLITPDVSKKISAMNEIMTPDTVSGDKNTVRHPFLNRINVELTTIAKSRLIPTVMGSVRRLIANVFSTDRLKPCWFNNDS